MVKKVRRGLVAGTLGAALRPSFHSYYRSEGLLSLQVGVGAS